MSSLFLWKSCGYAVSTKCETLFHSCEESFQDFLFTTNHETVTYYMNRCKYWAWFSHMRFDVLPKFSLIRNNVNWKSKERNSVSQSQNLSIRLSKKMCKKKCCYLKDLLIKFVFLCVYSAARDSEPPARGQQLWLRIKHTRWVSDSSIALYYCGLFIDRLQGQYYCLIHNSTCQESSSSQMTWQQIPYSSTNLWIMSPRGLCIFTKIPRQYVLYEWSETISTRYNLKNSIQLLEF